MAEEWRGELAAIITMPITAAQFVRGVRHSTREFVADPLLSPVGVGTSAPAPSNRRTTSRFPGLPQPRVVGRVGASISVVGMVVLASIVGTIGTDGLASIVDSGGTAATAIDTAHPADVVSAFQGVTSEGASDSSIGVDTARPGDVVSAFQGAASSGASDSSIGVVVSTTGVIILVVAVAAVLIGLGVVAAAASVAAYRRRVSPAPR